MAKAKSHLEAVTRAANDPAVTARRAAAVKRAARDRLARLEQALAELPVVTETKRKSGAKDRTPRVSTTDAEARVMKMADGGFRPAYNVQFATTTDAARAIVGVAVTNRGSDQGQVVPMLAQIEERTGVRPAEYLVDGPCPSPEPTPRLIRIGARKETARPSLPGASGWALQKPRPSTNNAPPPPRP
jgi:hypothetical protein